MSQKAAPKTKGSWWRGLGMFVVVGFCFAGFLYLVFTQFPSHSVRSLLLDSQGNVYVPDDFYVRIDKFNGQGESLGSITGEGQGQFQRLSGVGAVAFDRQGNLYALDDRGQIRKFDSRGNFVQGWKIDSYTTDTKLVVDSQGSFYITLGDAPQVHKFNPQLQPVEGWAAKAGATGPVQDVSQIALDNQDNVYLYDPKTKALSKYDSTGQFLQRWDNFGTTSSISLVFDQQGNLYHTTTGHQIQKLNNQGQVIVTWGTSSTKKDNIREYRSIQVDGQGNVSALYSEFGPYSVDKYDLNGQLVKHWTVGWPQWAQPLFQYGVLPVLVVVLGYLFRIGLKSEQPQIDPLQESLPAWVRQAQAYPQTLQDHLNLKNLETQKQRQQNQSAGLDGLGCVAFIGVIVLFMVFLVGIVNLATGHFVSGLVIAIVSFGLMATLLVFSIKREKKKVKKTINPVETLLKQTLSSLPAADRTTFVQNTNDPRNLITMYLPMNMVFCFGMIFLITSLSDGDNLPPMWLLQIVVVGAVILLGLLSVTLLNWWTRPKRGLIKLNWSELLDLYRRYGQTWLIFTALTFLVDNLNEWIGLAINGQEGVISISSYTIISTLVLLAIKYGYLAYGVLKTPQDWIFARLKRDDYEGALRRVAWLRRFVTATDARLYHVWVLKQSGRLLEAEYVLHEGLVKLYPGTLAQTQALARLLSSLAGTRMDQGRYAEAMFFLEEAIKLKPDSWINYSNLAEIYLRAAVRPERALELLDWGNQDKSYWWFASLEQRTLLGERAINRAWTLAQLRRQPEADRFLNDALRQTDRKNQPHMASIYYRAACIRQIQGNALEATDYMRQAVRIDPVGLYGQWAKEALHVLQPA